MTPDVEVSRDIAASPALPSLPLSPTSPAWASAMISGVSDRAMHNRAGMKATLERLAASVE